MKKVFLLIVITLSIKSFADVNEERAKSEWKKTPLITQELLEDYKELPSEKKEEFIKFKKDTMRELRLIDLDVRELEIKIEREMLQETPRRVKIEGLLRKKKEMIEIKKKKIKRISEVSRSKYGVKVKFQHPSRKKKKYNY